MNTWKSGGLVPQFMTSVPDEMNCQLQAPAALPQWKSPRYPIIMLLGEPQSQSGSCGEVTNSDPVRFRTSVVQLVGSCYNDWLSRFFLCNNKVKVKLSLYRPWRPLGLGEVEAPTFSDIRLIHDAGRFLPPGRFLVLTSVRGWVDPRTIVRLEGLGKLKNPPHPGFEPATFQLVA
jgi:hypothetical protein